MNLPIIFRFFSQIFRFNLFEVSVTPCKSYHNRFIFDWESFHFGAKILKAMKEDGSPQPEFDSDDDRSYYLVRLPVHPKAEQLRKQATTEVKRMLAVCAGEHTRQELKEMLGLKLPTDRPGGIQIPMPSECTRCRRGDCKLHSN